MSSIRVELNKDKLGKDEFWQIITNAKTFSDLVKALNHYRGNGDHRFLQLIFKKCMKLAETGFVLNEEVALWRRVLTAIAHDDGILFIFNNGLMFEFRQDKGGKVRMHISVPGEG